MDAGEEVGVSWHSEYGRNGRRRWHCGGNGGMEVTGKGGGWVVVVR